MHGFLIVEFVYTDNSTPPRTLAATQQVLEQFEPQLDERAPSHAWYATTSPAKQRRRDVVTSHLLVIKIGGPWKQDRAVPDPQLQSVLGDIRGALMADEIRYTVRSDANG